MFEIRLALPEDAGLIGRQRRQMFLDAGQPDDEMMAAMERAFVPWLRGKIAEDKYIGWLASAGGTVVGPLPVSGERGGRAGPRRRFPAGMTNKMDNG